MERESPEERIMRIEQRLQSALDFRDRLNKEQKDLNERFKSCGQTINQMQKLLEDANRVPYKIYPYY